MFLSYISIKRIIFLVVSISAGLFPLLVKFIG